MFKRSRGSQVVATALVAAGFAVGGVVTGTAAFAEDSDPTPPAGSCLDGQIKDNENGYTFFCVNGKWKYWKFGTDVPSATKVEEGSKKSPKPINMTKTTAPRPALPPRG